MSSVQRNRDIEAWRAAVEHWQVREPDAGFVEELNRLLRDEDFEALKAYLGETISFGTAGLRAEVGWGSARVNEAVIARVSWALGRFVLKRFASPQIGMSTERLVIVGYDARPDSQRFAHLCSEVLAGLGIRVLLAKECVPTPLVAFLVRELGACAGVVVTASHNPRGDNGFKVYDENGAQISSPWDREITQLMGEFPPWNQVRRCLGMSLPITEEHYERYLSYLEASAAALLPSTSLRPVELAYTALHGVSQPWIERAMSRCIGAVNLHSVMEQGLADGSFPTTPFPNPEEEGSLDLLLQCARVNHCELALANDPDGDRLAVCLLEPDGQYLRLSGDAVGLLLADITLRATSYRHPVLISTIVSSPALDKLASARGATVRRTLTGFKWLCRAALSEPEFLFAYEDALGYCFAPPENFRGVMDKDGVLAAVVLARFAARTESEGGLHARLVQLYEEFGFFGSFGRSRRFSTQRVSEQGTMDQFMLRLRSAVLPYENGWHETERQDFLEGATDRPDYLGAQDLLLLRLERIARTSHEPISAQILVRPSGTEPKLKIYLHLSAAFDSNRSLAAQQASLEAYAERLAQSLFSIT